MSSLPIANLLNQTILVAHCQGISNDMGDAMYGTPAQYKCRIDFGQSLVYGLDGAAVPSVATVYIDVKVGAKDKLMLPISDESKRHATDDSEVVGRIDMMPFDREAFISAGWNVEEGYLTRVPLSVKTLYDGRGKFSHCEVAV